MPHAPHSTRHTLSTRLIFARQQIARFIAAGRKRRSQAASLRKNDPDLLFPIALATLAVIAALSLIHLFVNAAG